MAPKNRWTTCGEITLMAKKPSTTDGMPARISSVGLSTLRTLGRAYSER